MKSLWIVLTAVAVLLLSNTGVGYLAFAGDVIKPTLKGQDNKYRKAGEPQAIQEEKAEDGVKEGQEDSPATSLEDRVSPRRGPHDDRQDPYGRRLGPDDDLENRYGRRGGRFDSPDRRYDRPDGRYDGQDERFDRRDRQPGDQWQQNNPLYGSYDKAPTPQARIQQQRLQSHFRNHYRQSQYYRQAYSSSRSGRFRHFNDSRYQSNNSSESRTDRPSRFLPYRYR
ncbi:MAG: hypothetical protein JXK94_06760 [Deltaproteobacteria bacterium]|nr:hypothetical protein [Deltaproteobacteria bacterium]